MRKTAFVWILPVIIFTLFAEISAQSDMTKEKQMISDINAELEKYMVSGNYTGALKHYTDDAVSLPSYQQMLKGKKDIEKRSMEDQKSGMKITAFDLETLDVFGSGDLVYEIGTYKITMEMPNMKEPVNDKGKYLTVYQKEDDGSLKIKAETWNTDINPWAEMEGSMDEKKPME
jgi:ketosteroid isomerase-like protein